MYGSRGQDYGHGQDHLSGWETHGLDASGWSAGYANTGASHHSALEWSIPHTMPKTTVAGQEWAATVTTAGAEDRDLWTTAAGAVTPNATPTSDLAEHGFSNAGATRGEHDGHGPESQGWVLVHGVSAPGSNPAEMAHDWEDVVLPRSHSHKRKPSDMGFS